MSISSAFRRALSFCATLAIALASPPSLAAQTPFVVTSFDGMATAGFGRYELRFTAKNVDPQYLYLTDSGSCACASAVSSSPALSPVIPPGQTQSVVVTVDIPSTITGVYPVILKVRGGYSPRPTEFNPASGTYQFPAASTPYSVSLSIVNGIPTVASAVTPYRPMVTPKTYANEIVPFGATVTRSFAVSNAGTQTATYSVTPICSYSGGPCTASKTTTTVAPGATDSVAVTLTAGTTVGSTSRVSLIAAYTNAQGLQIADTGFRVISAPGVKPVVSPKNSPTIAVNGSQSLSFDVIGAAPSDVSLTPLCTGWLTNCSAYPSGYDPEDPGHFQVQVAYTTPTSGGNASTPTAAAGLIVRVMVGTQIAYADTALQSLALGYAKPSLTPKNPTETDGAGQARTFVPTITNTGNISGTYSLVATCTGLTACPTSQNLSLAPGAAFAPQFQFTAPALGQTGTIRIVAKTVSGPVDADTTTLTINGGDVAPPSFQSLGAPAEGATIVSAPLSIAFIVCDPDGPVGAPTATLNGSPMTVNANATTSAGCASAKSGTLIGTASPGANTLSVSVSDGIHTTTQVVHFTYDEAGERQPVVTALRSSGLLRGGLQSTDTFTIRNPSTASANYSLSASCSGGLTSCTVSPVSMTVAAGQTVNGSITYTTPSAGSSGTVTLVASYAGAVRTSTGSASVNLQFDQAAPTVVVSGLSPNSTIGALPTFSIAWCDADGTLATHTVTIDGSPLADTYASETRSGCTTAGSSNWSNQSVTLGAHTLVATATDVVGHVTTTTVPFTFALPPVSEFQPRVTPRAPPVYLLPNEQTWAFAVRNAGTRSAVCQLTPICDAGIVGGTCHVDHEMLALGAGQSDSVRLTFSVASLPASPATFKLVASYRDQAQRAIADTGIVVAQIPSLAQLYQPQIAPDPVTHTQPVNAISPFLISVTNTGIAPVTYQMSYAFTGGFTTRSWLMADTLRVGAGQSAYYMVQTVAPSTVGTHGTATVTASYSANGTSVSATAILNMVTVSGVTTIAVAVSPRGVRRPVGPNTINIDTFTVTNTGSEATRYKYSLTCGGAASACVPSAPDSTPLLPPQQAFPVPVRYTAGPALGSIGTVAFHVQASTNSSIYDDGLITDSVVAVVPLSVATRGVTGGATIDRAQCLTVAIGDAAAYECGDLRLAHALPATTTLSTTRAPTLVYNNRHQSGMIVVPADVRVNGAAGGAVLWATVTIKGQLGDSVRFNWSAAQADGLPRRIAVPVNARAKGLATGVYEYTFQVRATVGATTYSAVATDSLVVINRGAAQFGPGWWLDGLEQLFVIDATHRLWVGGDGSTRVYAKYADTTWLATPKLDRVDSLTSNPGQTAWTRRLRNGATVEFNSAGRHVATTNVLGHRTRFVYNAANQTLLDSIVLPTPGNAPVSAYTFARDVITGYIKWIDAPGAPSVRRTSIGFTQQHGLWILTSITDPDKTSISFGLDATDRVVWRKNRRAVTTTYAYDEAQGLKGSSLTVDATPIARTFCATETASLTTCAAGPMRTDSVRTWFDGPRTDVGDTTWFKLTAYGAPAVITDALHQVTTIDRGDTLWPLLATRVRAPNGHEVRASYDAQRGLMRVVTDVAPYGGDNAVTTYDWDAKWDAVTLATLPTGGGSKRSGYDAATGRKLWEEDGRGSTARVNFTYTPVSRQLQTVSTPGNAVGAVNRIDYDTYGNVWKLTTPSGIVNETLKDAIGRDTLTKTPTDRAQTAAKKLLHRYAYDASGRDSASIEWNGPDSLGVLNLYDAEGNLTEVLQRGVPDAGSIGTIWRRYVYDDADRKTSERLVHGTPSVDEEVLHYEYDAAGNLTTGGRDAVGAELTYDALNRVVLRNGTNMATFTYDSTGMRTANNPAAQISRSYYPNGALKTDTLRIATADWGTDFGVHVYGLTYTYDLAGHKVGLDHPRQLARETTAHTSYGYNPVSGLLSSVVDKFGQTFTYDYDAAGRLNLQQWRVGNSPLTETRSYDADSHLARRTMRMANNSIVHDDSLFYDARDKVAKVVRLFETGAQADTFAFDGRGRVTQSYLSGTSEKLTLDAYGNALQSSTKQGRPGTTSSIYERGSGRLMYRMSPSSIPGVDTTAYDIDWIGNQYHTLTLSARGPFVASNGIQYTFHTLRTETEDGYDDRNKLFVHRVKFDTLFQTAGYYDVPSAMEGPNQYIGTEVYHYDALGRRIWSRSIKGANCNSSTGSPDKWTGCHNTLTRTIWDGDQILYEIRTDGSSNSSTLEDDAPYGAFYGVIGYVHGYGIDEPLSLDKGNQTIVLPFADWRGHFDGGLCGTTKCTTEQIKFPQRTLFGAANSVANLPAPSWFGSLIEGQEDASGYLYRRNRYFDPATGRFTQEDPIGLAGGFNLYGFGDGDAVNNSDPFGLCVWDGCILEFSIGLAAAAALATHAFVSTRDFVNSHSWASEPTRVPYGGGNPEVKDHGLDATGGTGEVRGVVDRAGSKERHKEAMKGMKPVPGKDRDVFPPAVVKPDATGTSVKPLSPGQNRAAGAKLGHELKGIPDGTPIILTIPRPEN